MSKIGQKDLSLAYLFDESIWGLNEEKRIVCLADKKKVYFSYLAAASEAKID